LSGYGFNVGGSGYDSEDRLVNWQRPDNNLTQAWNLSLVGDWNSITENSQTQSRTHGPTHELQAVAGQAVQHDVKGNMTLIPANLRPTTSGTTQPLSLSWDFDNRLASADTNNDSTADVFYKWDALGRRVLRDDGTNATVYVQSDQQTIADYTAGTAATSPTYTYVYASYIDEPVMRTGSGNSIYFHRNQQYSITALTNGGGAITERYAYSAYGTPTITDAIGTARATSAVGNRFSYTGREWDEALALYHYRARIYDSGDGRFCSRDPIGFRDGANLYGYLGDRPIVGSDPLGLYGYWLEIPIACDAKGVALCKQLCKNDGEDYVMCSCFRQEFISILPYPGCRVFKEKKAVPTCKKKKPTNKVRCKKATTFHINAAGISDEHDFKTDWGAIPNSLFEICACDDGSIQISRTAQCGNQGPKIVTTERWK
jgi:RHS repeat-associated protein